MNKKQQKFRQTVIDICIELDKFGLLKANSPKSYAVIRDRLKRFNKNDLIKAGKKWKQSDWWQDNYPDAAVYWLFSTNDKVKKLLKIDSYVCSYEDMTDIQTKFVRCYNWCVRNYFQRYGEYHTFIDSRDKETRRIANFISANKKIIKNNIDDALGFSLKNWTHYIFVFVLSAFRTTKSPPPLYYYYSDGLLKDFKCDRVQGSYKLMVEWLNYQWVNLKEDPIEKIIKQVKHHADSKPNIEVLKLLMVDANEK